MKAVFLLLVVSLFITAGCKTSSQLQLGKNEKGCYYAVYRLHSLSSDSISVSGRIRTELSDSSGGAVLVNGKMHPADPLGNYRLSLPAGKYTLVGVAMPFYRMVVPLSLSRGDSIKLDFYLKVNNEPIID